MAGMSTLLPTPVSVLAAIDFSEASSLVLQQALDTARRTQAEEIHFLHVQTADGPDQELAGPRTLLEAWVAARLSGAEGVPHTVKVVVHEANGNPADVIVEMASDLLAAVIVVGTHGRKGLQRMLLGSVAEAVVRNAGCPVLVVSRSCIKSGCRASSLPARVAWRRAPRRQVRSSGANNTARSTAGGIPITTRAQGAG